MKTKPWKYELRYIRSQKTIKIETIFLKPKALESQSYGFISTTGFGNAVLVVLHK